MRKISKIILGKPARIGIFGFVQIPMNPTANRCPLPKSAIRSLALDPDRGIFLPFNP